MHSMVFDYDDFYQEFKHQVVIHQQGAIYRGETDHKGTPNGRGIMIFDDGAMNEGHWVKG